MSEGQENQESVGSWREVMTESKSSECYCDETSYRKCVFCQEAQDREDERSVCESWNWNCTPRECAEDARGRGWSVQKLKSAMRAFGYRPDHIANVAYEFAAGE